MTKREKVLSKVVEEMWEIGRKNKITTGEWGSLMIGLFYNALHPHMQYNITMGDLGFTAETWKGQNGTNITTTRKGKK